MHRLLQEIVSAVDEDDKPLNLVEIILDYTGVVSGEFGMRAAYQRKKTEAAPWLEDERDKIRLFAERHTRSLDRQIAAEQRRVQEDIDKRIVKSAGGIMRTVRSRVMTSELRA